ncbi:MAG: hypothetical protein VR64_22215 [Desulfatitalea sp. BRH_c12]|nr:MAG: hypothetical protein VR64_22215 [Desulfatitalea sp. BRH_c12]
MFSLFRFKRPRPIQMSANQVLPVRGRHIEITCLTGAVWITDGVGGERIIRMGQGTTLKSRGRVCVQAFAPSVVRIQAPAAASAHTELQPATAAFIR